MKRKTNAEIQLHSLYIINSERLQKEVEQAKKMLLNIDNDKIKTELYKSLTKIHYKLDNEIWLKYKQGEKYEI